MFQETFIRWLGPEPEKAIRMVAKHTGYSLDYVRWAAGLAGQKTWPGSRRFERKMYELGCSDRRWRDRPPSELAQAFHNREMLHDPRGGK